MLAERPAVAASEPRLRGETVPRAAIGPRLADRLYALFSRYYLDADRAAFDRDLAEKGWVIVLRDADGAVRGFTTLMLYELAVERVAVRAVFSGNTIIERAFWGEQELVRSWCRFMAARKREAPERPLFWYLISGGYRTYLYLPLFFRRFYPRVGTETPPFEAALIERLGRMKFPAEYRDGVIRVARPRERLRGELAEPAPAKLANPHVGFFVERNPGYLAGDELVCVAEFSAANTRRLAHAIALEAEVEAG